MSSITVKTVFNGESRRFTLTNPKFAELKQQLFLSYPQLPVDVVVKFEDDENEYCTISTDNELVEAFNVANAAGNKTLKLIVTAVSSSAGVASVPAASAASAKNEIENDVPAVYNVSAVSSVAASSPSQSSTPNPLPAAVHTATSASSAVPAAAAEKKSSPVQVEQSAPASASSTPTTTASSNSSFPSPKLPKVVRICLEKKEGGRPGACAGACGNASAENGLTDEELSLLAPFLDDDAFPTPESRASASSSSPSSSAAAAAASAFASPAGAVLSGLHGLRDWLSGNRAEVVRRCGGKAGENEKRCGRGRHKSPHRHHHQQQQQPQQPQHQSPHRHHHKSPHRHEHHHRRRHEAQNEHVWTSIVCDGCNAHPIRGVRFTCTVCKDFDLCGSCEARNVHPRHHPLVKQRGPEEVEVPADEHAVHSTVRCDGCGCFPIHGLRFKCTVCKDFDLCEPCEAKREHPAEHPMIKLRTERRLPHHLPRVFRGKPAVAAEETIGADFPFLQHPFRHPFRQHPLSPFRRCRGVRPLGVFVTRVGGDSDAPEYGQDQAVAAAVVDAVAAAAAAAAAVSEEAKANGNLDAFAAPAVSTAAAPSSRGPRAAFVKDVTYADGAAVRQGVLVKKAWQLRNAGTEAWPHDTKLIFLRGDRDLIPGDVEEFPVGAVKADDTVEVTVPLLAKGKVGDRSSVYFQLADSNRNVFGPRVWAEVVIVEEDEKKADSASASSSSAAASVVASAALPATSAEITVAAAPVPAASAPAASAPASASAASGRVSPTDGWEDVKLDAETAALLASSSAPAVVSSSSSSSSSSSLQSTDSGSASSISTASVSASAPAVSAAVPHKFAKQLQALQQMGFVNASLNEFLLEKNGGDLIAVANWLVENSSSKQ